MPARLGHNSTIEKNIGVRYPSRLDCVALGSPADAQKGGKQMFQFFIVVEVPVSGWMPNPQYVPQQLTLLPQALGQTGDSCPACKNTVVSGWKYCPQCGVHLCCPSCGSVVAPSNKYCSNCGKVLNSR